MKNEPVVIFTSCDENLINSLPTLIFSVHENMPEYKIRFYLIHTAIPDDQIEKLSDFSNKINIYFEAIQVEPETVEQYLKLKYLTSCESKYPVEGMYACLPNIHLPSDIKRALYLDAGDVILANDIRDFYFSDFKGNVLTVSKGFASDWNYIAEDLYERQKYLELASEYFNAGVVLFNVELMRKLNINFDYYTSIVKFIQRTHEGYRWYTFGNGRHYVVQDDQGLLSTAFTGFINFYDPENSGNINTTYNFRPFVIECNKNNLEKPENLTLNVLKPKIIHLLGNKPSTPHEKRKELLKISQECLALWDKYEQQANEILEGLK